MESINATINRISSKLKNNTITLRTAQIIFLEKVKQARKKGYKKGILIFATGLGKTLASLSDALRMSKNGRILVLAHNHNLLYQHARDFKLLNKTRKIGFLYKSKKDVNAGVLFANIMTIKQKKYLHSFKPDEFDYIIIDETHHAGAKSYKCIFDYFKPKFLLGMTATPNRTDQIDILPLYDNNIIYEVNVFEAINKGWLRPYKNIFLWDKWCDYNKVRSYRLKSGYFKYFNKDLGRAYFCPERDKAIVKWFKEKSKDRRGIGFCVGVNESIRMAKLFNDNGIKSVAIWGGSGKGRTMTEKKRNKILEDYEKGKYQMIFNCEIIGEGLHLPSVDVVLKLRPTMSAIKDNQHNGRGLYNIEGLKLNGNEYDQLLIMDLVGNYKNAYLNYIYQGKLRKNKNRNIKDIREIVELPIGCEVEFEERVVEEFNKEINYDENYTQNGKNIPKEEILDLYLNKRWNIRKISLHFCVNPKTIKSRLTRYDVLITKPKKKDFIKNYFRIKGIIGDIPSLNELEKHKLSPMFNKKAYYRKFGNYISFLKLIGENFKKRNKFSNRYKKMELIKIYKELKKKLGRPVKYEEISKIGGVSSDTYISHFGGWKKFLKSIGEESYTKNLKDAIRDFKNIYGNKKPYRSELWRDNTWIAHHFNKSGLLDKYCKKKIRNTKETILEFTRIYGGDIPTRKELRVDNERIYHHLKKKKLLNKYCQPNTRRTLQDAIKKFKEIYGDKKPFRRQLYNENHWIYHHFLKNKFLDEYCLPTYSKKQNNNLKISKYKPLIVIPQTRIKRKGMKKTYEGINTKGYQDRTTEEKDKIRPKIAKYVEDDYKIIILESPELSFIKELEKQGIKPKKVTIPNNKESVKLVDALINHGYKIQTNKNGIVELTKNNSFPIAVINTDAQTWLINTQEKPDFLWLDYCGAFSFYAKDLDILFAKHFDKMKLILTYNLFDPAKDDENYYLTRAINYVLKKVSGKSEIELLEDITYRYKKNMYNIGFQIQKTK